MKMGKKKSYFAKEKETRDRIKQAICDLSELVQVTLGPGGRNVFLEDDSGKVISTKDGVTVARCFEGTGDIERVVANASREVCERTVRQVGDGTTTAIVLAAALVKAGKVNSSVISPQELSRRLKKRFIESLVPQIMSLARPIKSLPLDEAGKAIRHVALISSNHDREISEAVAEAVELVGDFGVTNIEEGTGSLTRVEHSEGFSFTTGLADLGGSASQAFVNRQDFGDCVADTPYVALYDGEINDPSTIIPLLERVASEVDAGGRAIGMPLVIFSHRFGDSVLKIMAQNFRRGTLSVIPCITPRNGQEHSRSQFLHDLAAYVGGKVFDPVGQPLQEAHLPQLGIAERFKLTRSDGHILGSSDQELIEKRIEELKKQMEGASEFDRSLLRSRIGRLTGGVATIFAGGATVLEAKERRDRVVDAVSAVRSAMELGVVPGGGTTLLWLAKELSISTKIEDSIFSVAIRAPFRQILLNTGLSDTRVAEIEEQVGIKDGQFTVYDALNHSLVDWYEGGIVDPAKVTISALENALSVAQLLMSCGGLVVCETSEAQEQVKAMQQGMMKAIQDEALG
jgi:chaperonin GroEL